MSRLLLGQLLHRRGRFATLVLAILVGAASFSVLTASANTTSVHVRQTLEQSSRGARWGSTSSAKQKVRCVSGAGLGRREYPCKTRMRLVCHKSPGQTVLRRIPKSAYYANVWNIEFSPYHRWGADGPPVKGARLSIRTPRGTRREEAIVSLLKGGPPGNQVIIWARCS